MSRVNSPRQRGRSPSRIDRSSGTRPLRKASTHGAKGRTCSGSQARPTSTRSPSRSAAAATSASSRLFPTPASPTTVSRRPWPARTSASAASRLASSGARPISGSAAGRSESGAAIDRRERKLQAGRPTIELRCRARLRGRPAGHPTAQDRLVEPPRPRLGVEPELPLQHVQAHVVLPECGAASAEPDVEAHHCPVDRLLERIQRQQMQRRPERQVGMTHPALVDEKTRQRLDGQLAEPLTLDQEPGLERFGWTRRPSRRSPR